MLFVSKAQFAQFIAIQKSFCKENEAVGLQTVSSANIESLVGSDCDTELV